MAARAVTQTEELRLVEPATPSRWDEYVSWLDHVSHDLSNKGALADLMMCERLVAKLRQVERDESSLRELGAMQHVVRRCLAGTRSFLRAVSAGHVELTPELRRQLTETVREIAEVIMNNDLHTGGHCHNEHATADDA